MMMTRAPLAILDNVRSALNVGAIFRSADCAGVAALALCGLTPAPPNTKLLKTSLGAEQSVPWRHWGETLGAVRAARAEGRQVVALESAAAAEDLYDCELPEDCALVVGHEVFGVAPEVLETVDRVVSIPLCGVKSSLNVATAFGVVVYELLRRRRLLESGTGR
jgi:tRNA G18 (ribose-2'-O)-methylase SpoU